MELPKPIALNVDQALFLRLLLFPVLKLVELVEPEVSDDAEFEYAENGPLVDERSEEPELLKLDG